MAAENVLRRTTVRNSTIPVTMWTFPATFCCRPTVPVTKTFPFQSPNRHCRRWASHRGGERGKPRMGHWAWFPLRCEPRLSTLSISGREQSQQCRRPRGDTVGRVAKIEFSVPIVHEFHLESKLAAPTRWHYRWLTLVLLCQQTEYYVTKGLVGGVFRMQVIKHVDTDVYVLLKCPFETIKSIIVTIKSCNWWLHNSLECTLVSSVTLNDWNVLKSKFCHIESWIIIPSKVFLSHWIIIMQSNFCHIELLNCTQAKFCQRQARPAPSVAPLRQPLETESHNANDSKASVTPSEEPDGPQWEGTLLAVE